MRYGVQSSDEYLFFWRQNYKSPEILLIITLASVQLQHITFFLETPFLVIRSTPLDR